MGSYLRQIFLGMIKALISFHFLVVKANDSQKRELNHCTSQEPKVEKTRKEVSVLDVEGKPQGPIS